METVRMLLSTKEVDALDYVQSFIHQTSLVGCSVKVIDFYAVAGSSHLKNEVFSVQFSYLSVDELAHFFLVLGRLTK